MSTFRGIVSEFAQIRIDYFRRDGSNAPPLACFLSHVHSDHLAGLDTLRSPFVYCSAATREILLRLERYPCRISYAKGILEARQQTYKHLSKVLKPIPLETPTKIELAPGYEMQVTLFDANHCPGAVMFLMESNDVAILYTGDMRSEPWFVNSIARHPLLVEYTSGIRNLTKIYLDTSFTRDVVFQTKRQGIAELLQSVARYPPDTKFYFQAWTYGYEDVWLALSKALKSPIHVDEYKMRIYNSLSSKTGDARFAADAHFTPLAPALTGYICGNARHPGCLTSNTNVRLHSCEKGNLCDVASQPNVVKIQPIVAHLHDGTDLAEAGVGGGGNDFQRSVELGFLSPADMQALQQVMESIGGTAFENFSEKLVRALSSGRETSLGGLDIHSVSDDFTASLQTLSKVMVEEQEDQSDSSTSLETALPRVIRFPYARHSSYQELCHFVDTFKPLDVWPCTEDVEQWWRNNCTIESYFGEYCSGTKFAYDELIGSRFPEPYRHEEEDQDDTQTSGYVSLGVRNPLSSSPPMQGPASDDAAINTADCSHDSELSLRVAAQDYEDSRFKTVGHDDSQSSIVSQVRSSDSIMRRQAYKRTLDSLLQDEWESPLSLLSTDGHHSKLEEEL